MNPTAPTFDDDKLGLKPFSEKLERFLMVEHDFVEGSLVVSLNAPFGSGKTTFLSMWNADLDQRRSADTSLPKTIFLNAWESDFCGDALLSIVTGLANAAGGAGSHELEPKAHRLREAAKDVAWFATGLANKLASKWTGVDPVAAGDFASGKKKARQPPKPDFVTLYEQRTAALKKLKQTLRDIYGGERPKAFVFVDELDRCRPDYAVGYLETIKHVFDVHGLVFVLAVDYEQLGSSARALFGQELKFPEYFRKFVQRSISLPEPGETGMQTLAGHYTTIYLEREGKRTSLMKLNDRAPNIVELISALKMTPRQIQEVFRVIGHVAAGDAEQRGKLNWCLGAGLILMSALQVADPLMYRSIGTGQKSCLDVGNYLIKVLGSENAKWWFCVFWPRNFFSVKCFSI